MQNARRKVRCSEQPAPPSGHRIAASPRSRIDQEVPCPTSPPHPARPLPPRLPAQLGASAPLDPARAGIIHLGLGAFHPCARRRAHGPRPRRGEGDWGIIGFANRSRSVIEPMAVRTGIYSVLEDVRRGHPRGDLVDVHRGVGVMTEEPERVVREIADPHRRLLTLTVSEGGYYVSPRTGRLDVDDLALRADLEGAGTPRTVIGLLARGLAARAGAGNRSPCCPATTSPPPAAPHAGWSRSSSSSRTPPRTCCATCGSTSPSPTRWWTDRPGHDCGHERRGRRAAGRAGRGPVRAERFSMWAVGG